MRSPPTALTRAFACLGLGMAIAYGARSGPSLSHARGASQRSESTRASLRGSLDEYLQRCEAHGWSGSVLVAKEGEIVLAQGYGLSDRGAKRGNDADTMFEIGEAMMPFTACAIMKLVEESRISLEDTLAQHLPGVPHHGTIPLKDRSRITILDVLTHYSGMPKDAAAGRGDDLEAAVSAYLGAERHRIAGLGYEPSNGGFALLAGVVELTSGMGFSAFCEEHLFGPAGMEDTGFIGDTDLDPVRLAAGYDGERMIRRATEQPYGGYGYHNQGVRGMVTTVSDLWRFTEALRAGDILAPGTVELMEMTVRKRSPRNHHGLGWAIGTTQQSERRVGHSGHVRGFQGEYQRFPDSHSAVILLSNVEEVPSRHLARHLESLLWGGKARYPVPPPVVTLDDSDLNRWLGTYLSDRNPRRLVVERAGTALRIDRLAAEPRPPMRREPLFRGIAPEGRRVQPAHQEHVRMALEFVTAVERGNSDWIRSESVPASRFGSPDHLIRRVWPKQIREHGSLESTVAIASTASKKDFVEVILELQHEKRARQLKVVFLGLQPYDFMLEQDGEGAISPKAAVELATKALHAIMDRDYEYLQSMVYSDAYAEWSKRIASDDWPSHLEVHGPLERFDVLSVYHERWDSYEVAIQLSHKKKDAAVQIGIYEGGLCRFDWSLEPSKMARTFRPVSKSEFVNFDWYGQTPQDTVSFLVDTGEAIGAEWRSRALPDLTIVYSKRD